MPGGYPFGWDICNGTSVGSINTGTGGTTVTASGSANTKGSWTQLIAASASDCVMLGIMLCAGATQVAVDIGVGGSGNEVVVIPNLMTTMGVVVSSDTTLVPLAIPAGTRIAARCASPTGSATVAVALMLFDGGFAQMEGLAGADAIGFVGASTQGTAIALTNNAKGSYVQMIAATARDYLGFLVGIDSQNGNAGAGHVVNLDIAVGGSGSEVIVIPNHSISWWNGLLWGELTPFYSVAVPAGTRMAVRGASVGGGALTMGVTLYGFYQ